MSAVDTQAERFQEDEEAREWRLSVDPTGRHQHDHDEAVGKLPEVSHRHDLRRNVYGDESPRAPQMQQQQQQQQQRQRSDSVRWSKVDSANRRPQLDLGLSRHDEHDGPSDYAPRNLGPAALASFKPREASRAASTHDLEREIAVAERAQSSSPRNMRRTPRPPAKGKSGGKVQAGAVGFKSASQRRVKQAAYSENKRRSMTVSRRQIKAEKGDKSAKPWQQNPSPRGSRVSSRAH